MNIKKVLSVLSLLFLLKGSSFSQILINEIDLGIPDAIEIYNKGTSIINIKNWKLKCGDDQRVQVFTLSSFDIYPGTYIILVEGTDSNQNSRIYLGTSELNSTNINWSNSTAGAVELIDPNNKSVDFVTWGTYQDMSTSETNWSGEVISLPQTDTNLGRNIHLYDSNQSSDIIMQISSLGTNNNTPPIFPTSNLSSGFLNQEYQGKVEAIGPAGPFTYELVSGSLPSGLTLNSDGTFTGTIHETGNFNFYIRANDSQNPPKSALELFTLNTYDINPTFSKNILLVNGVSWSTYNDAIRASYNQKAFWGDNVIDFWDCFDTPTDGYPNTLPSPKGHGAISLDVLVNYSLVIWIGNNYNGDLEVWQDTPVFDYILLGGNFILLTRMGQDFIDENFRKYLGIQWREEAKNTIANFIATYPNLENIKIEPYNSSGHTLVAVFSTLLTDEESTLLFKETQSFNYDRGLGVWKKPKKGGQFRETGGQVVFLCGRPYKMDITNLRNNMEIMIHEFFNITSIEYEYNKLPMDFSLHQNFPNPFNSETVISFTLPREQKVLLEIYDSLGKKVCTLVDKKQSPGVHKIIWNVDSNMLSSGVFFIKLKTDVKTDIKKMIYLG